MSVLLKVDGIDKHFGRGRERRQVLHNVTLTAREGSATGLVGESGSGKSTVVRTILGLERPDRGRVIYDGVDLKTADLSVRRQFQREVQVVFQDPYSSLNPRMTIEQVVGEGLRVHRREMARSERRDRVVSVLERVGLGSNDLSRNPGSFSGGQRQRIAIARALVMEPRLLVCDEAVSALDVSIQAQVVNLLSDARKDFGLTVLFVAHDLAVVRFLCDDVAVIERGHIVETGATKTVFSTPQSEYTRRLLAAVPNPVPRAIQMPDVGSAK